MKQFITILLSVFYLASIAGLPVKLHYCKGDLVSVEFLNTSEECCCVEEAKAQACCSEESNDRSCQVALKDECCSFEHFFMQYNEDNQFSNGLTITSEYGKDHIAYPTLVITEPDDLSYSDELMYFDLPPPEPQPLWLLHCSITFYG